MPQFFEAGHWHTIHKHPDGMQVDIDYLKLEVERRNWSKLPIQLVTLAVANPRRSDEGNTLIVSEPMYMSIKSSYRQKFLEKLQQEIRLPLYAHSNHCYLLQRPIHTTGMAVTKALEFAGVETVTVVGYGYKANPDGFSWVNDIIKDQQSRVTVDIGCFWKGGPVQHLMFEPKWTDPMTPRQVSYVPHDSMHWLKLVTGLPEESVNSFEIDHLMQQAGVTGFPDGSIPYKITCYPRSIHVIKAHCSFNYSVMPKTIRGLRTQANTFEKPVAEVPCADALSP